MIYEVVTTKQAEHDLRSIYEYIAFQLFAPDAAKRQFDRLEERILGLAGFPERFCAYEKDPWFRRGLRVTLVDRYRIFYIPNSENRTVLIIRILYEGVDIDGRLKE